MLRLQVIKNLLFVGKVIYLISPECDVTPTQEVVQEEREGKQRENGDEDVGEEEEEEGEGQGEEKGVEEEKEKEEEEDEDDKDDRPPSLLWLMNKLALMAKREAAHTPKVPTKVTRSQLSCG